MNPDGITKVNYSWPFIFMHTVYILYSANLDRYYIGYTGVLLTIRLRKHLANHKGFTGKQADWIVVYAEECLDKKEAIKREKQIKVGKAEE